MTPTGIGLLAAALSATIVAAPAGWFAYDLIAKPGVIREERVRCEAEVRTAAAEAVAAEQARRFRAGELATEQFIQQSQAAADDARAVRDVLELEIERYVQRANQRSEDGEPDKVVCGLDADDLDLLGVHGEPDQQGGR